MAVVGMLHFGYVFVRVFMYAFVCSINKCIAIRMVQKQSKKKKKLLEHMTENQARRANTEIRHIALFRCDPPGDKIANHRPNIYVHPLMRSERHQKAQLNPLEIATKQHGHFSVHSHMCFR